MNTNGQPSRQQQQQSGGWQPKTKSPSSSRSQTSKHSKSVKRPLNPLQNQAHLHQIMSLFQ